MNNCEIVKDLIPLYVEGLTNNDSCSFIEEHLEGCESCKSNYNQTKEDFDSCDKEFNFDKYFIDTIGQISKYQRTLKLFVVLIVIFMANAMALTNAGLLTTIPLLVIVPFLCFLFNKRPITILFSSFMMALATALLFPSGYFMKNLNYDFTAFPEIYFSKVKIAAIFAFLALFSSFLGVCSAVLLKMVNISDSIIKRLLSLVSGILIFLLGIGMYSYFAGNPVSYISNYYKANKYVYSKYQPSILKFIGLSYDMGEHVYVGEYYAKYDGDSTYSRIIFHPNGRIEDEYYKYLEVHFADRLVFRMNQALQSTITDNSINVSWNLIDLDSVKLEVTKTEEWGYGPRLYYEHYIDDREASKLNFQIDVYCNKSMKDNINKRKEYIEKSMSILNTLKKENFAFKQITIFFNEEDQLPEKITINPSITEEELKANYGLVSNSIGE